MINEIAGVEEEFERDGNEGEHGDVVDDLLLCQRACIPEARWCLWSGFPGLQRSQLVAKWLWFYAWTLNMSEAVAYFVCNDEPGRSRVEEGVV